MSIEAMNCAWKAADAPGDPGPMWLLVILCDHASDHDGEDWTAFPSVERLMARSKFKRSACEGHLKTLVALGWVSRRRRIRPDGRRGVYDYELHRDPALRERLRVARETMAAAGMKPSEEVGDADYPCVNSTHGPCVNSEETMREIHAEPCVKSTHHYPSVNPQDNPHSERAHELALLFDEIVAASPRAILKFYDRDAAFGALTDLAEDGVAVAELPDRLRRMAEDPAFKSRKHPPQLHTWLAKRQFDGWREQTQLPLAAAAPAEPQLDAAPAAEQAIWAGAMAHLRNTVSAAEFGTWIARGWLAERGGQLFVVAYSGMARDWIAKRCWKLITDHWTKADAARRVLVLTSKSEFEAASSREQGG